MRRHRFAFVPGTWPDRRCIHCGTVERVKVRGAISIGSRAMFDTTFRLKGHRRWSRVRPACVAR